MMSSLRLFQHLCYLAFSAALRASSSFGIILRRHQHTIVRMMVYWHLSEIIPHLYFLAPSVALRAYYWIVLWRWLLAPTIKIFQSCLNQHEKGVPMIDWYTDISWGSYIPTSLFLSAFFGMLKAWKAETTIARCNHRITNPEGVI